jgi:hypothetical protein
MVWYICPYVSVKPSVHIMEVGEYAMYGDDGVDIATRRARAEFWLGVMESEEVACAGKKNWIL